MPQKDIEWQRYNLELPDGGPYYAETNPSNSIVEPWNAISSLLFLIPAIYWAIKIKNNIRENSFIAFCIPLLLLGGLGSTFFHAFRSSKFLLWMDVLPILVLTIGVSTYFWHKVFNNWWISGLIMILIFALRRFVLLVNYFPAHTAINISYAIGGTTIFLPIIIVLSRTKFRKLAPVVISVFLFIISLFFREIDARNLHIFPMGTHFLWHICSAVASFFLAQYLYFIKGVEINEVGKMVGRSIPLPSNKKTSTSS